MGHWNYRIVRTQGEGPLGPWEYLGLYEVYYDDDGKPVGRTVDEATFGCDADEGPEGVVGGLELALRDARTKPVLDDAELGGECPPLGA